MYMDASCYRAGMFHVEMKPDTLVNVLVASLCGWGSAGCVDLLLICVRTYLSIHLQQYCLGLRAGVICSWYVFAFPNYLKRHIDSSAVQKHVPQRPRL